mgnify:CR=1 FL=1
MPLPGVRISHRVCFSGVGVNPSMGPRPHDMNPFHGIHPSGSLRSC